MSPKLSARAHGLWVRHAIFSSVTPLVPLTAPNAANGYTTTVNGSQISVGGNISVNPIAIDVLIGDV